MHFLLAIAKDVPSYYSPACSIIPIRCLLEVGDTAIIIFYE